MNANIQAALNENFAATVPDWNGDVQFGAFQFDPEQEVNNVDGRRKLTIIGRRLQEGTCPPRIDECDADFCRWGCLVASTTDCGTSALTNWIRLEEVVRERLLGLNFPCLGTDELQVILVVEDPEASRTVQASLKDSKASNEILLADQEAEAVDDRSGRVIEFSSELDFHFFEDPLEPPSSGDINGLVREVKAFFNDKIRTDPRFDEDFIVYDMANISHQYLRDGDANADIFKLQFVSKITLKQESTQQARETATAMAHLDFNEFIGDYAWKSTPLGLNPFQRTEKVLFSAKGTGN